MREVREVVLSERERGVGRRRRDGRCEDLGIGNFGGDAAASAVLGLGAGGWDFNFISFPNSS